MNIVVIESVCPRPRLTLLPRIFRHGIMTMTAPGVAASYAFQSHPGAFEDAPFFYGMHHIMRAARIVAAGRAKHWRDGHLVKTDREYKQFFQEFIHATKI